MFAVVTTQNIAHVSATMQRGTVTTAYASGGIIAQSTVAANCSPIILPCARAADFGGVLRRMQLKVNDAAWVNATVRVHIFRTKPTITVADQGTFITGVNESNWIGNLDVVMNIQFNDPFVKGVISPPAGQEINIIPDSGTQNVYAILEARGAVTPAASKTFTLTAEIWQN